MSIKTVTILNAKAEKIISIVREMREKGYVQGKDFEFTFYNATYDKKYQDLEPRRTIFTFYDEELATFFGLTFK